MQHHAVAGMGLCHDRGGQEGECHHTNQSFHFLKAKMYLKPLQSDCVSIDCAIPKNDEISDAKGFSGIMGLENT
jgi:hypothetical protein